MAVFRVEKSRDFTVMSNYHLKDRGLSLKSKGLLSMILSLPDEWNYTTRGLASICKEGVDMRSVSRWETVTSYSYKAFGAPLSTAAQPAAPSSFCPSLTFGKRMPST